MRDRKNKMMKRARQPKDLHALVAEVAGMDIARTDDSAPQEPQPDAVGIELDLILPDPIQPRRALPEILRARWIDGAPLAGIFEQWQRQAREDLTRHNYLPEWTKFVETQTSAQEGRAAIQDMPLHPDTLLLIDLLRLATSIYQTRLEQPIAVYPVGEWFRVLHGERRLLAFHLLTWLGYAGYDSIPAIIRPEYNPLIQAYENGARQNLNAISIARQYAIILKSANDLPIFSEGQPGQSWYAEAVELSLPPGTADQVALMLGLPSPRTARLYRNLLNLPPQVWNWADQFNWPEGKIRRMVRDTRSADQLIRVAQDEVTRALGGEPEKQTGPTLVEKVIKRADRTYKALTRVTNMDEDELAALPASEKDRLMEAAKDLINRLR